MEKRRESTNYSMILSRCYYKSSNIKLYFSQLFPIKSTKNTFFHLIFSFFPFYIFNLLFLPFSCEKCEKIYFDHYPVPKRWSKYTTSLVLPFGMRTLIPWSDALSFWQANFWIATLSNSWSRSRLVGSKITWRFVTWDHRKPAWKQV